MHTLSNAAQEFIELAVARIRAHPLRHDAQADLVSVLREQATIAQEREQLDTLLDACREIARLQQPSIAHILRHRGFGFEADRINDVVLAIEAIEAIDALDPPAPDNR